MQHIRRTPFFNSNCFTHTTNNFFCYFFLSPSHSPIPCTGHEDEKRKKMLDGVRTKAATKKAGFLFLDTTFFYILLSEKKMLLKALSFVHPFSRTQLRTHTSRRQARNEGSRWKKKLLREKQQQGNFFSFNFLHAEKKIGSGKNFFLFFLRLSLRVDLGSRGFFFYFFLFLFLEYK